MPGYINEASWDWTVRILLGAGLLILGWSGLVGGTLGLVLKVFGFLPLATGLLGWCPAYAVFGFTTRKATPVA